VYFLKAALNFASLFSGTVTLGSKLFDILIPAQNELL